MPTSAANTSPIVSNNWNMPVPLPREFASRHSARYIGTTTPTRPADMPCRMRPQVSIGNPFAKSEEEQITGIEIEKQRAEMMITFLRPSHSDNAPANSEDSTDPNSTAATTNESCCFV